MRRFGKSSKKHVNALASTDDWLRENPPKFNAPIMQRWEPRNEVSVDHPGVKGFSVAYQEASSKEVIISGFRAVADPTFLSQADIPIVLFGPGRLGSGIHGPDEYVPYVPIE